MTAAMSTIDDKIAFLGRPAAYPDHPDSVDTIETHMSWVFLAGDHAYKLKKPVVFPFLDFSRDAARRANCEAEVRLNRRLAPQVYLGVVELTLADDGSLRLGGTGPTVDWLVRMKRLPKDRMLDVMIAEGRLAPAHIADLAGLLGRFYRSAGRPAITPQAHLQNLETQQIWNRQILEDERHPLDHAFVHRHLLGIDASLRRLAPLIESRILNGRYVDGHGDLRPEHVCFCEPIAIFDCLEFDDRLRFVDPFDEVAFLCLECELAGAAWVEPEIVGRMRNHLGETVPPALFRFYKAFRATMRARMALSHLPVEPPRDPAPWIGKAERYLALAHRAIESKDQGAN